MSPVERLKQRRDFAAVYRQGRRYRGDLLMLRVLRTDAKASRVGLTAGKALGNAVIRNRVKRRLREAYRSLPVASGWDLVLNARGGAQDAGFQQLRRSISELMADAGVLEASEASEASEAP